MTETAVAPPPSKADIHKAEHTYVLRLTDEEWELWHMLAKGDGSTKIGLIRRLLRDEGRRRGYLSWPGRKQRLALD